MKSLNVFTKFVVAIMVLFVGCCFIVPPVQGDSLVTFKKNINQVMKQWSCFKPKERLVYLEDEYMDYNPAAMYIPPAAVVSRCDKMTGCCKNGQRCSPSEEENTTFIVEEYLRGRKTRKEIVLANHLRCECLSASSERR